MNNILADRLAVKSITTPTTPAVIKQKSKTTTYLPKTSDQPQHVIETYHVPTAPDGSEILQMRSGRIGVTSRLSNHLPVITGMAPTGTTPTIRSGDCELVRRISPLSCELIYVREGMVYTWLNRLVGFHLASDAKIKCANDQDQEKMDEIISHSQLRLILRTIFQHKYTYGNWIGKFQTDKGEIIGVEWIDPKYFDALRDNLGKVMYNLKGTPMGYVQYIKQGTNPKSIPKNRLRTQNPWWPYQPSQGVMYSPKEIIHMKLNQLGDSWWGIGILEPIYNYVKIKQNADEGFGEMMQRVGFPRIMGYVGDPSHPPTQEQIDDVWEKLTNLHTQHQFVGPYYYKFELLESNKPDRFKFNLEYFQNGMVTGLGGPKPLVTGLGEDTNRATLADQKLWLEIDLKNQQMDVSISFREQILKVIANKYGFSKVPTLVWKDISTDSLASKTERLVELAKAGLINNTLEVQQAIHEQENLPIPTEAKGDSE